MSTLEPGTRIPMDEPLSPEELDEMADQEAFADDMFADGVEWESIMRLPTVHRAYYRGLVEGLVLGGTMGTILGLMCAALAWSHLGG